MPRIEKIIFRCFDPDAQRQFYKDILGMTEFKDGSVGYGGEEASLVFRKSKGRRYEPADSDLYWKISLAVPDIELAHTQLRARGVDVSDPYQLDDIAYLSHFKDPEGFTIELVAHWFKDNQPVQSIDKNRLGGGAHINLLTLRSADIEDVLKSCSDSGMTLLSIMTVRSRGFVLYFLAYTSQKPPSSDAHAVENREWVFQRKYTVLEIKHLQRNPHSNVQLEAQRAKNEEGGYLGTLVSDIDVGIPELLMAKED